MENWRAALKNLFYKAKLVSVLDYFLYYISYVRNRKENLAFRNANPGLIIPPDYFLYETYRLNYEQFFQDGEQTAKEIMLWTKPYLPAEPLRILDWGCGVSRIVIHISKFTVAEPFLFACDINKKMIDFGKKNYPGVSYRISHYNPPTDFESSFFDLIYAFSILTHVEAGLQLQWIREIHRVLREKGVYVFTTHGRFFYSRLLQKEKEVVLNNGAFTKSYGQKGHRMMSTYNSEQAFRSLLKPYFEILEFYDGESNPDKIGGQDLWIVRKK